MRILIYFFFSSLVSFQMAFAQMKDQIILEIDELNNESKSNWFSNTNLAIELGTTSLEKALAVGYGEGLATAYNNLGVAFWVRGELDRALRLYYQSINVRDSIGGELALANTYHNIGNIFKDRENYKESKAWFNKALAIRYVINDSLGISYSTNNLGLIAQAKGKYDSAYYYLTKSLAIRESLRDIRGIATSQMSLGKLNIKQNDLEQAETLFLTALDQWKSIQHSQGQADTYIELAKLERIKGNLPRLQYFVDQGIAVAKTIQAKPQLLDLYQLSTDAYLELNDTTSAFMQLQNAYMYRIDIYNQQRGDLIQQYNLDQVAHANALLKKENLLQKEQILRQNDRVRGIGIIIFFLVLMLFMLYRFLRARMKSNQKLALRNNELNQTLRDLKKTQSQLVQVEKMASLGTLTAGVSHEINNPLNYIMGAYHGFQKYFDEHETAQKNQFEFLLLAMKSGLDRATSIVKGLNQFSRDNKDNNEDCHVNEILENCHTMINHQYKNRIVVEMNFATEIPHLKGNIGRLHQAFLNVLVNAMQSINNEGKVSISTSVQAGKIMVSIKDSGCGINEANLSKVFDPFFTTKDPGEGFGLGLSIAYSVIEDHKGQITIQSKIGEGTLVEISIPVNDSPSSL